MGRETTSLFDQRVYAQATPPQDTRDGIIWVDTSLADKPTKVYSADTQSFVTVGVTDYSQLENRIIGTEVDEYIDPTPGQVESRGFQTPTNYASIDAGGYGGASDSGTVTDGLENYVGYFIDSYEYEINISVDGSNDPDTNLSFTPSGSLNRVNGLDIPTDPEDTINYTGPNSEKTVYLSDSANFDPIQVTESDPFSFSHNVSASSQEDASYTVEYTATFNVVTNLPHNHEFNYAN